MKTFKYFFIFINILILIASCTTRDKSIVINFDDETNGKKWAIEDINPELPKDWSAYEFLTFDIFASST